MSITKIKHIPGQYPDGDAFKYNYIKSVRDKFNCNCFVEFGTHKGDSVIFLYDYFDKIITIEPVKKYYEISKAKFLNIDVSKKIEILNIKSINFIEQSLSKITNFKTLFWIDSHIQPPYTENASNDLYKEILLIYSLMEKNQYILLIDDYRLWSNFCNKNSLIDLLETKSIELIESSDMVISVPSNYIY
jgi:hypothetical protein